MTTNQSPTPAAPIIVGGRACFPVEISPGRWQILSGDGCWLGSSGRQWFLNNSAGEAFFATDNYEAAIAFASECAAKEAESKPAEPSELATLRARLAEAEKLVDEVMESLDCDDKTEVVQAANSSYYFNNRVLVINYELQSQLAAAQAENAELRRQLAAVRELRNDLAVTAARNRSRASRATRSSNRDVADSLATAYEFICENLASILTATTKGPTND